MTKTKQKNIRNSFQKNYPNYLQYEEKCREISNYFSGLEVMDKLCNENNIKVKYESENPLLYYITLRGDKNWLILQNYLEKSNKYTPQFNCTFLFDVSWGSHFTIFKDYYILDRTVGEPMSNFREYYKDNLVFDFLEITKVEVIRGSSFKDEDIRIKCNIINVNLDKILQLVKFIEEDSKRRKPDEG